MSLENANLSRRKLLKAGAIGVPAASSSKQAPWVFPPPVCLLLVPLL